MQQPLQSRLGSLDVLEAGRRDAELVIILNHGFGADAYDLYPLSSQLPNRAGVRWIFPQAPGEVPLAPGLAGRAWFPIDMQALEEAMASGSFRDFSRLRPPGLDDARAAFESLLTALDMPPDRVLLGGFSQGAMVATDVCLSLETSPAGLVVFSGTLLDRDGWLSRVSRRAGMPFIQSHGRLDPVLSYTAAEELERILRSGGLKGHLRGFFGGHEIHLDALRDLDRMIASLSSRH